jgi:NAD(P)-dependent dehydrogenase (short-subunit alcohol dehydrogenase family)
MGLDFAKAVLGAGHNLVATGRNPDKVSSALGDSDDPLVVKLDVTTSRMPRQRPRRRSSAICSGLSSSK